MRRNCARCSELRQMLQLSESDNLACKGSTMGEHMLTQLFTKEQIDAQLEKLDRKIKELETNDILDISDVPKRIQEPPSIQPNELETSDILDIIDEPKRMHEPPRIYEKPHLENSRLYQAGEFIVSAIAIVLIIFAVIFTALISATFWEIIQQFGVRQYVSVTILAGILFGWGYFLGYARKE